MIQTFKHLAAAFLAASACISSHYDSLGWVIPEMHAGAEATRVGRRSRGVSVAQGKRNARKARQVARHRKACRGRA